MIPVTRMREPGGYESWADVFGRCRFAFRSVLAEFPRRRPGAWGSVAATISTSIPAIQSLGGDQPGANHTDPAGRRGGGSLASDGPVGVGEV